MYNQSTQEQMHEHDNEHDNDDEQVGRILSRREVIALLGAAGGSLLVASCAPMGTGTAQPTPNAEAATVAAVDDVPPAETALTTEVATVEAANATAMPACVVRPEVTAGPYYVDVDLERSDVRADPETGTVKEGALLMLTFNVSGVSNGSCSPLAGAVVDIWHCDALGVYSGVSAPGFDTSDQKFLRGYQVTGADGAAAFTTIYPGWYPGRAVHIHFKIRVDADSQQAYEFTSQLFFDEDFTDQVFMQEPYASRGQRNRLNSTDNIYNELLLLTVVPTDGGYAATFDIGLDLSDSARG